MKRFEKFLVLLMVGVAFTAIGCGTPSGTQTASTDGPKSQLTVSVSDTRKLPTPDTINLGRMRQGEVINSAFTLHNNTTTPLVIIEVRVACGCAKASYSTKPVLPGESRQIDFRFDSKGMMGTQYKFFDVEFTAGSSDSGPQIQNLKVHFEAEITQ